MKDSTIVGKKKFIINCLAIFFWLVVWQFIGYFLSNKLLLPMPITVIKEFISLIGKEGFYISVINSLLRIVLGFFIASIFAIILSILSYNFTIIKILMGPLISFIKSTPVASIIIVALVWIRSENLSIFISFLMVLPTIYINMVKGLENTDIKLLEMATVFKVSRYKKIRYIYIPAIKPYFVAASSVALGFSWKAGIAAELIGLPSNTIGEALYKSKIYLNTPELFAWTLLIILISIGFEKVLVSLIKRV